MNRNLIDSAWVDDIVEKLDKKLSRTTISCRYKMPTRSESGIYNDNSEDTQGWANGFWGALNWLMYDMTKKDIYKETAQIQEEKMNLLFEKSEQTYHDVGFQWNILSGASYKLTGNLKSKNSNFLAANLLAGRYNPNGEFLRAWNDEGKEGWTIIDSLMNIPLLYWASEQVKDHRYKYIAMKHADKTLNHHIRPDGSVKHICCFNSENGEYIENLEGQGYSKDSAWSRGQSWAVYGFTLSYIYTKEERYLDAAKATANYFIAASCSDFLPRCDFRSPPEPVIYDASAALIAACGMIELAQCVPEFESDMYLSAAMRLVKTNVEKFADWSENTEVFFNGTTTAYHFGEQNCFQAYGEYFFVDAIRKLKGDCTLVW